MAYLVIENFKAGLDKRRNPLMAEPGTVWQLDNAHITSGGEIERRTQYESLGSLSTLTDIETFGLLPTEAGIYLFGSEDGSGLTLPTNYLYQRLQHPAVLEDVEYVAAKHAMTALAAATVYENQPWVAATFADGQTFCYYAGSLIGAFRNGLILDGLTDTTDVAEHIKDIVNTTGSLSATRSGSTVIIQGVGGTQYSMTLGADGRLALNHINNGTPGVAGTEATAQFHVSHGASGGQVDLIEVDTGAELIDIIDPTAPVEWSTDADTTAAAITTAINTFTPTVAELDYKANNEGRSVFVRALAALGADANGYELQITTSGELVIGGVRFLMTGFNASDKIDTIEDDSATDLLGGAGPIEWATSNANWAMSVAAAINEATGTTGYVATNNGNILIIGRAVTRSDDAAEDIDVNFTGGGGGSVVGVDDDVEPDANPIAASVQNSIIRYPVRAERYQGTGAYVIPTAAAVRPAFRTPTSIGLSISGGTPPYYGTWEIVDRAPAGSQWDNDIDWVAGGGIFLGLQDIGTPWTDPVFSGALTFGSSGGQVFIGDTVTILTARLTITDSGIAIPRRGSVDVNIEIYPSVDV